VVPDFALRIQSMIRSLREVILPALPNDQMLAIDQANILVGYLRIMAEQHDRAFEYLLVELSEYAQLVGALTEDAQGGESIDAAVATARSAVAEAAPVLRMSIPRQAELAALVKSLKVSVDELLHAARRDGTAAFRQAAVNRVMEQAARQVLRERVWFSASGFELDANRLPSIDAVLRARAAPRAAEES
jgi:ABC-type transporter Mla subunit MlaD